MKILSNAFPTNMPDSEKVSQGGPANFARLFRSYIASNTNHNWVGLLFENVKYGSTDCRRVYSSKRCSYYRLKVKSRVLKKIVLAKKKCDPEIILKKAIRQIVQLIRAQKPDLIFLNGFSIYGWLLLKAGEIASVPVVIQHAGIWTKELNVHKKLYTKEGRKIMEKMEKDSTRIASHEIFLNEWSKKYYNKNVAKGNPKKMSIVPLPFDFGSFEKANLKGRIDFTFEKKRAHIGLIARWDEIKNHKAFLSVAKRAKKERIPWSFHSVVEIPKTRRYEREREEYKRYINIIPALDNISILQDR